MRISLPHFDTQACTMSLEYALYLDQEAKKFHMMAKKEALFRYSVEDKSRRISKSYFYLQHARRLTVKAARLRKMLKSKTHKL